MFSLLLTPVEDTSPQDVFSDPVVGGLPTTNRQSPLTQLFSLVWGLQDGTGLDLRACTLRTTEDAEAFLPPPLGHESSRVSSEGPVGVCSAFFLQ